MNRVTDIIVAGVMVLLMAGCGGSRYPQALVLADSLMNSRPDSALAVLEGAEGQMAGESKSVRMRYQLLRHQAMNKAYVPFTSDSLMLDVVDYYDSHGTANERMLAHYLLGCVYRDMEDAPKALTMYHDAVDCVDTTTVDCDFALLSRIHGQMASLMICMQLPYNALEESYLAATMAHHASDTLMSVHYKSLQAHSYFLAGQLDSVIAISEQQSKDWNWLQLTMSRRWFKDYHPYLPTGDLNRCSVENDFSGDYDTENKVIQFRINTFVNPYTQDIPSVYKERLSRLDFLA